MSSNDLELLYGDVDEFSVTNFQVLAVGKKTYDKKKQNKKKQKQNANLICEATDIYTNSILMVISACVSESNRGMNHHNFGLWERKKKIKTVEYVPILHLRVI